MSYVILGIHGLANKPAASELEQGWRDALLEGLRRNLGNTEQKLEFNSVYWADVMYGSHLEPNEEPYVPAKGDGPLKTYRDGWWSDVVADVLAVGGEALDIAKRYMGVDSVADKVLEAKLQDLFKYYHEAAVRDKLHNRLRKALLDVEANKRIMLIAHSMGSIIAYDVLRAIGRDAPNFAVDHFVTIGSPLGLPHVKNRIYEENHLVRTPTVVRRWTNFADRRDPVALDAHLKGDYAPNDRGVRVNDDLVINSYISPAGKANYHKSYGYLRAPELSEIVRAFL